MVQGEIYEVVIAKSAMLSYQEEILPYLLFNFTLERSLEIDYNIEATILSLAHQPSRGSKESFLSSELEEFRFILHRETKFFELKIIYYFNEADRKVFITDFFPTRMNPSKIKGK